MQKDLENLWYNYVNEISLKKDKKEKTAISRFVEKEESFRSILDEKQIEKLEEYDDAVSELNSISEKNAFIKGIMFATKFIFQALYE
ncbi:MAG: hypothetical protein IJZ16_12660 [Clostridia bacterium]|nr:hypothetical protein [Clostridia bacterium]